MLTAAAVGGRKRRVTNQLHFTASPIRHSFWDVVERPGVTSGPVSFPRAEGGGLSLKTLRSHTLPVGFMGLRAGLSKLKRHSDSTRGNRSSAVRQTPPSSYPAEQRKLCKVRSTGRTGSPGGRDTRPVGDARIGGLCVWDMWAGDAVERPFITGLLFRAPRAGIPVGARGSTCPYTMTSRTAPPTRGTAATGGTQGGSKKVTATRDGLAPASDGKCSAHRST